MRALRESLMLSFVSAAIGAVLGALLAYLIVTAPPSSILRRVVTAVCGVLAQFGGVTLAFALDGHARLRRTGHRLLADVLGTRPPVAWLYELPGLILVYTYFQIPLMVIVFLPALDGLRPQWREAAVNLGATTSQYWTAGRASPCCAPAFLGSALLLFANAFAAYATAAALVSQGAPIIPLLIRSALTSEIVLGQQNFGYALALEMVVVVAIVMALYAAAAAPDVAVADYGDDRGPALAGVPRPAAARLRYVLPRAAAGAARLQHHRRAPGPHRSPPGRSSSTTRD